MWEPESVDRAVDIASVVLISIAAVLTAVCGYQSGRWSGQQARLYQTASADRTLSAEASDRANMLTAIDVGMFLKYVDARDTNDTGMVRFITARFRPEMKRALDGWLATNPWQNPRAPSSPFVMKQYRLQTRGEASAYEARARASFEEAIEADHRADGFLLLTVVFAAVSFLAGVSTKMTYPRHAVIVVVALVATLYGLISLVRLPFL